MAKNDNMSEQDLGFGFNKPLMLTPAEDMKGYVGGIAGRSFLFTITLISVLAVLLIFIFVIKEAIPFFTYAEAKTFFTSFDWKPESTEPRYGILAIVIGSIYVTIISLLIAVPLGLTGAIFLSDIAPFKLRQAVKPIIEILAAIPSVVYGFFAVKVFAPWLQEHLGFATGTNALNAGIILGIMALPTIISISEDSISAVGRELREASYGLGATRTETMFFVILPAAHSGIIAGVILGMMRAIGETMVVWMASGNATQVPSPWWDLADSVRTMTATIAGEMGETVKGSIHYHSLFSIGLMLLTFTFILNMVSEHFMSRAKKKAGK